MHSETTWSHSVQYLFRVQPIGPICVKLFDNAVSKCARNHPNSDGLGAWFSRAVFQNIQRQRPYLDLHDFPNILLPAGQKSRSNAASVAGEDQQVQDGCARDAARLLHR